MKKAIIILALVAATITGYGQALPVGSVPFGEQAWISPDGGIWVGKDGNGYKKLLVISPTAFAQSVESSVIFENGGSIRVPAPTSDGMAANKAYVDSSSSVELGATISPTTYTITNSKGNDAVIIAASETSSGVMTSADKANLNALVAEGRGDIIAGDNVTISGDLTDRLTGAGDITINASGGISTVAWTDVTGKPSTFTPSAHTHAAADVVSGILADARIPSLNASKVTAGTFSTARIPSLPASQITSGTLAAARLPIATSGALGGVRVGTGLAINPATGVLSAQQPEGSIAFIDEITWTEFATPNGAVHPLSVGYYAVSVSTAEEASGGPKSGDYTMIVFDRQPGSVATGAGTVFFQHQDKGWCYNVWQDYGGNIRIYPLNSAETVRVFYGSTQTSGTQEQTLWELDMDSDTWFGEILTHNGDQLELEVSGSFTSSSGDKTLRVRMGITADPDQAFGHTFTAASTMWSMRIMITRTSSTSCDIETFLKYGTSLADSYQLLGSDSYTDLQVLRITGQSVNPITFNTGRVTYHPYFGPIDN